MVQDHLEAFASCANYLAGRGSTNTSITVAVTFRSRRPPFDQVRQIGWVLRTLDGYGLADPHGIPCVNDHDHRLDVDVLDFLAVDVPSPPPAPSQQALRSFPSALHLTADPLSETPQRGTVRLR